MQSYIKLYAGLKVYSNDDLWRRIALKAQMALEVTGAIEETHIQPRKNFA